MLDRPLPAAPHFLETDRRRENASPSLSRLYGACDEAPPVSDPFDVVQDRDLAIPCQDEVAVHGVHGVLFLWDCELRGAEALSYGGATEDATGSWRVPERAGIGEDVGANVG